MKKYEIQYRKIEGTENRYWIKQDCPYFIASYEYPSLILWIPLSILGGLMCSWPGLIITLIIWVVAKRKKSLEDWDTMCEMNTLRITFSDKQLDSWPIIKNTHYYPSTPEEIEIMNRKMEGNNYER